MGGGRSRVVGWLVIPPKPKYTHPYKSRFGPSVHCGTSTGIGIRHLAPEYLVSCIWYLISLHLHINLYSGP